MEPSDVAKFARNFSAMVRIQGPDPKGMKMRRHAFHLHQSGITTLSASGLLLQPGSLQDPTPIVNYVCSLHGHSGGVVITAASLVEPFLIAEQRNSSADQEFKPRLIPDARINVLVEISEEESSDQTTLWLPAHLLALVDVSASFIDLQSLVKGQKGSLMHSSWEVGWTLIQHNYNYLHGINAEKEGSQEFNNLSDLPLMIKSATRIAFLGIPAADMKEPPHLSVSQSQKKGDILIVVGSPFGILSPLHFLNSVSVGAVANLCPASADRESLLMADVRCLPGMEGAAVFDQRACLSGLLTSPLRQKEGGAEIQLVIKWDAIESIRCDALLKATQNETLCMMNNNAISSNYSPDNYRKTAESSPKVIGLPFLSQSSLEKVVCSIALITVGDGSWASGIVVSTGGLILTNAHLLEPWRFGKSSLLGLSEKETSDPYRQDPPLSGHGSDIGGYGNILQQSHFGDSFGSEHYGNKTSFAMNFKSQKRISVCLSHMEPRMWCTARVVFISKGPLDVALLQLDSVPRNLHPITPEFLCPSTGSKVHVIGHGLLGPWSDIGPSVSSGFLSKIIRVPDSLTLHKSSTLETLGKSIPVMLQTTAAVHPGASGGAVVNVDGHMVGLITSNAKHGGGTVIPHMNFSIPCAALEPIFKFSENQDMAVLKILDWPNKIFSSIWALVPPPSPSKSFHQKIRMKEEDLDFPNLFLKGRIF